MDTAEYLFPVDLQRTPTPIRKVLLVGSCLSELYCSVFKRQFPDVVFDHVLFNNAQDLPSEPPSRVDEYDLQYVQIPLRSVMTDGVISALNLGNSHYMANLLLAAKRNIDAMLDASLAYNAKAGLLTFVANFIVPQTRAAPSLASHHSDADLTSAIQELNVHLARSIKARTNVFYADVDAIAASLGKRYFLDDSIYFYAHNTVVMPYLSETEFDAPWAAPEPARIEPIPPLPSFYENRADEFFRAVFRQMESGYRIVNQIDMVKLVIFDLDNTLWRGQIAEHYQQGRQWPHSHGWPLGLWEAVHHLRWRGIITSIASKNDHDLVASRWDDVVQPPFLKLKDFVHPQINWHPKTESIARILEAVNVTAKSAVFVDDNPVERESVRATFPEIRTIGSNPFLTRRVLLWAPETQVPALTTESKKRESMIRGQIERSSSMATMSREDFLRSLNSRVTFQVINDIAHPAFTRALELVNKTNQFNTTGERWSPSSLREFFADGRLIAFSVADRFVEYGLVGLIFLRGGTIHQFVMSCRVLGMDVERVAIFEAVKLLRAEQQDMPISARLIETSSNGPCRNLYTKSGFRASTDEPTIFSLSGSDTLSCAGHTTSNWLAAPAPPNRSEIPLGWIEALAPPQGEVFNGANFFDGQAAVSSPAAGGWRIPAGKSGSLTYHRYVVPIQDVARLAGEQAHFVIELECTPEILDQTSLKPDFTTRFTVIGKPGVVSDPIVRLDGVSTLLFEWDYVFTGEENCVVGALQVVSRATLERAASLILRRQRYRIQAGASDSTDVGGLAPVAMAG